MSKNFIYLIRFVLLVLLQIFILNKIQLSGYLNPYVYVLFILSLPFNTPKWLLLVLAFVMGITIDYFSNTLGMHAAATVFLAFARPAVINLVGTKDELESGLEPNLKNFGFLWIGTYTIILVFLHHLMLFYIEAFRFTEFFVTFLIVLINTVLSTVLILIIQLIFYRKGT